MKNEITFTTYQVVSITGLNYRTLLSHINSHPELKPANRITRKNGKDGYLWTLDEVRALANSRGIDIEEKLAPIIAEFESETAITPSYNSPIDYLIAMADKFETDENMDAYLKFKQLYDKYNEHDLSIMFGEVLRRFKFSYIIECVPSVQSQTLTAIRKGSLRGIDNFQFSFKSFLELMKFAGEHNTPVTEVSKQ